ncbi:MAG: hypothetical protein JNM09_08910 [Blastocatellia bacterium]|nr:hypothetical protein [Blastocatellia bacterium]
MKRITLCLLLLGAFAFPLDAQTKTVVKDKAAKAKLLGKHKLSLQWISWEYFGTATVTEKNGMLFVKGEQKSRQGSDFVRVEGTITAIEAKSFTFTGTIITQVSHNNEGKPCTREGEMTFAITGKRKYWRLQQMQSPCGVETDYVDIYIDQAELTCFNLDTAEV